MTTHRPPPIVDALREFVAGSQDFTLIDRAGAAALDDYLRRLENANQLAPDATPNPDCGCRVCNPRAWWMVVCDKCGNKRCPRAEDHRFECTGSNAVGQVGKLERRAK